MSWIDPDRKLIHEPELLDWVAKEHTQVFGYNPKKSIIIKSGFIHNISRYSSTSPYELVINLAYGMPNNKHEGHVFLDADEILHHWELYISQIDYNLFKTQQQQQQQEKERTNTMKNIQIQKANYIVQVQYPKGNYNDEKWSPSNFTSTLSSLSKDEFYEKVYNYAVPNGMSLKKGDYVLVGRSDNTMAVVKVVNIIKDSLKNMEEVNKATNYVYGKVNLDAIIKQVESAERAKYLKTKIDELKKTFEERKMLEIMAQNDPEAAKLIEEYKQLTLPVITKGE